MSYWKDRMDNVGRGVPDAWNTSNRSFNDSLMEEDRWLNDRMDSGSRNGPPSLFSRRPGAHLSSSNEVNSTLFDNYQPRATNRNDDSFTFRSDRFRPSGNYYPTSGSLQRNSLVDYTRARRILQKRALNAVGTVTTLPASNIIKRKRVRARKPQPKKEEQKEASVANDSKTDTKPKKPDQAPPECRIAVIWVNDEKKNLNGEQVAILAKALEQKLDELPISEDVHIPKFYTSGLSAGVYKLVCVDQKSVDWLKETLEGFTGLWEGAKFSIIPQSEINALTLVSIILGKSNYVIMDLLRRFEKQNVGFNTTKWRIHRELVGENKAIIVFAIDDESHEYLKKHEWRAFAGLRQFKFTLGVAKLETKETKETK